METAAILTTALSTIKVNIITTKMPAAVRNTVDRLDRPSAYYQGRVRVIIPSFGLTITDFIQNKRKYIRDERDGEREKTPDEPEEDPLKDATTLYVGNLYVYLALIQYFLGNGLQYDTNTIQVLLYDGRTDPRTICEMRRDQAVGDGIGSIQQDSMWLLLCGVLYPSGRFGLHEVHWRNEA
jgi:hypothetical protein